MKWFYSPLFLSLFLSHGTMSSADDIWQADLPTQKEFILNCLDQAYQNADGHPREAMEACKDKISQPCLDAPENSSTSGMAHCVNMERDAWDANLNDIYSDISIALKTLDRESEQTDAHYLDHFRDQERKWISYRDAECEFEALKFYGGSMSTLIYVSCMQEFVAEKTIDLYLERRFYINGDEGDF